MKKHKAITKKQQDFYLSPFFYTQINKLVRLKLVETEWKDNQIHYTLTKLGDQLAEVFDKLFTIGDDSI